MLRSPEEVDAAQEADEQRRVAERGQRAADIGDEEDEEDDDMRIGRRSALARINGRIRIIAAPVVPTRLAMAAPKARMPVLVAGVPRRVAGDQNAAGDDIERKQQDDEAEIFGKSCMRAPPSPSVGPKPRPAAAASAPPSRARSCRSDGARISETALARWRSTPGCRRRAAPNAIPSSPHLAQRKRAHPPAAERRRAAG